MIESKNVIKGLKTIKQFFEYGLPSTAEIFDSYYGILNDAISLLKEQEAVTIKKTKEHGFGVYGGICPKCRNWIQSAHSFCGFCGQAVKWY